MLSKTILKYWLFFHSGNLKSQKIEHHSMTLRIISFSKPHFLNYKIGEIISREHVWKLCKLYGIQKVKNIAKTWMKFSELLNQ